MGIDASTTSFGVALQDVINRNYYLLQLMRSYDESGKDMMDKVFPYLSFFLKDIVFNTVVYERTPDDFGIRDSSFKIMKQTEESVEKFLHNAQFTNVDNHDKIFGIFPNSWKSLMIRKDIDKNFKKVNKRVNSLEILNYLSLPSSVIEYYDNMKIKHSYDAVEALGILTYGTDFICEHEMYRTYRNFKRRRPITVFGKIINKDHLFKNIENLMLTLNTTNIVLYRTNEFHSFMENIYALDNDSTISLLISNSDDILMDYYKFLLNIGNTIEDTLIVFTLRERGATYRDTLLKNDYLCQEI